MLDTLFKQYTVLCLEEQDTTAVAKEIYKTLINEGVLCDEIADEEFHIESLGITSLPENIAEALSDDLFMIAVEDFHNFIQNDDSHDEELLLEYAELDTMYTVSLIKMDLARRDKITEAIPIIFTSLQDIVLYVDNQCAVEEAESIIKEKQLDIGTFGLLAVEDAKDALDTLGIKGMLIADQIPENAVAVIMLIRTDEAHEVMMTSDMYVIFEATEYVARI